MGRPRDGSECRDRVELYMHPKPLCLGLKPSFVFTNFHHLLRSNWGTVGIVRPDLIHIWKAALLPHNGISWSRSKSPVYLSKLPVIKYGDYSRVVVRSRAEKWSSKKKLYIYKQFIILNIVLSIKYSKKNVLSNVIFVFMLVSYGFEKPLYYFHI